MSAVLKKGAPSRSYPSKQRKLGPAPFASFEDLSDELESPGGAGDESKVDVMPEIEEDRVNEYGGAVGETSCQSPVQATSSGGDEDTPIATRAHKNVTATSSSSTVTFAPSYSAPTSGPTSGLQTPSTPRIDISCASSSTPPSDESTSEKELFQGGLGFAFHEEAVEDLRSSTEELDLGEEEISSEEERRRKRLEEEELREQEIYRRSSHPANIFTRKPSVPAAPPPPVEDVHQRKPSAHSLFLEGLLNRPCRHASFGHGDYMRPGAISSLSTHSAGSGFRSRSRSPSPNKIMFETSFCGSKPIPTKSMEADSPPKDEKQPPSIPPKTTKPSSHLQAQSEVVLGAVTPNERFGEANEEISQKSPGKQLLILSSREGQMELEHACNELMGSAGPKDIDYGARSKTPLSPQPSSLGFDSRRPSAGRRSVSPHKMLLETSFCGNKPIPTRSMEVESPPKDIPDLGALLAECTKLARTSNGGGQVNAHCHKTVTTAQVHPSVSGDRASNASSEERLQQQQSHHQTPLMTKVPGNLEPDWSSVPYLPGSPESPKSSDLWQPISPRMELRSPFTPSATPPFETKHEDACPTSSQQTQTGSKPNSLPTNASTSSNVANQSVLSKGQVIGMNSKSQASSQQSTDGKVYENKSLTEGKSVGFQSEKSESSKEHDDDEDAERTTEMKISEDPTVTVEDVPMESKGLFFLTDSFDEEGDLPYVPTTLPQEKSAVVPIVPVSERKKMALMINTVPVQRPKVNRPSAPASLNDYIEHSKNSLPRSGRGSIGGESGLGDDSAEGQQPAKMKINLPREDSLTNSSGGKGKWQRKGLNTTTWIDFANMGLLSPREIRRKMKEENGAVDDITSYHSDSSSINDIPSAVEAAAAATGEESESGLKLPKVPFAMDLDVHSNRSSMISQDDVQKSPLECSMLLGTPDEPDSNSKKSFSRE